jgi:formate dehydrogenase iron-sulfur subunit
MLGGSLLGSEHAFDMEVRVGAGAYVCGEETSLLNSLEGKRGVVRAKPPLPAHQGFFGRPTVINNVISLASVPVIMAKGSDHYRDFGMGRSRGTIPIQIAGNVRHGGLFEAAFGLTLGEIVDGIGGGTATGRPVKAVQVGGPLGAYFPQELFDTPFDYEAFAAKDGLIGHAGVVVFDDTADMLKQARFAFEFCAIESCGKCTPCRIGSTRGVEVIDRITANVNRERQVVLLELRETDNVQRGPNELWYVLTKFRDGEQTSQEERPLITGVTNLVFTLRYDVGPRLARATVDLTVRPNDYQDASFGSDLTAPPIRLVSSVSPRRLD